MNDTPTHPHKKEKEATEENEEEQVLAFSQEIWQQCHSLGELARNPDTITWLQCIGKWNFLFWTIKRANGEQWIECWTKEQ